MATDIKLILQSSLPTGNTGNTGIQGTTGLGYANLTSSSPVTIGTGTISLTTNQVASNTAYVAGQRVRVIYPTTPTNYMEGTIASFFGQALQVSVDYTSGSGTFSSWVLGIAGAVGSSPPAVDQYARDTANSASANTIYITSINSQQNSTIQTVFDTANNALAIALPNVGTTITVNTISTLIVANTTKANSTTTGALQVKGGVGISDNLYAGAVYTSNLYQINIPLVLNDVSNQFNGRKSVFALKTDQTSISSIVDSKDVEVIINGLHLAPYIKELRWPWITPYDSYRGFRIVGSNLIIYNAPDIGDQSVVVIRNKSASIQTRKYPFSASTIALGD